ncbi:hypothetical protein MBT42_18510 [Streptomyces sp. MBT42]|uniref:hypothetical protein n=1 Tax=Streptomyces sp. MBT42 TaxID=1488373 RepID=UPI001E479813|nr:hypothetical protein [Streptomyces sp. MBT42]MCD2461987.1 hypothetical protein [Streptomyces sp. MBT42]MCD2465550.1 hypothetical protein [Streptomyces sp. MBT42]
MPEPTPAVGRIVHYVSYGTPGGEYTSQCRAAIITEVDEYQPPEDGRFVGHLNLCVLTPDGMFLNKGVLQDEDEHRGGSWHWPERV